LRESEFFDLSKSDPFAELAESNWFLNCRVASTNDIWSYYNRESDPSTQSARNFETGRRIPTEYGTTENTKRIERHLHTEDLTMTSNNVVEDVLEVDPALVCASFCPFDVACLLAFCVCSLLSVLCSILLALLTDRRATSPRRYARFRKAVLTCILCLYSSYPKMMTTIIPSAMRQPPRA
jgi:hypothetical protein